MSSKLVKGPKPEDVITGLINCLGIYTILHAPGGAIEFTQEQLNECINLAISVERSTQNPPRFRFTVINPFAKQTSDKGPDA